MLTKIVRGMKIKWKNRKGFSEGSIGIIRLPGFFYQKNVKITIDGTTFDKKFCKTGRAAIVTMKREYIGKTAELEFEDKDLVDYAKERLK